jgi:6-phosphogluconolactonase
MNKIVEVFPDLPSLIQRALEITLAQMSDAIAQRDQFTIALAGGGTPEPLYAALAAQPLTWDKFRVFWGDERYVPVDHPDSNEGMARRTWLNQVSIPEEQIFGMPTNFAEPAKAAEAYEQTLLKEFDLQPGAFPTLDLVLLGIGPDGHTASLFPHTAALQVCDRAVTVGDKDGQPRITMTIPLINQARCVLFMVTGANKQTALQQIFAVEANSLEYPARFIQPASQLIWLLDQAAADAFDPPM